MKVTDEELAILIERYSKMAGAWHDRFGHDKKYVDDSLLAALQELVELRNGEEIRRLKLAILAISTCELTGVAFGDYVQSLCEDVLEGEWPECWNCGTPVHDGLCAGKTT